MESNVNVTVLRWILPPFPASDVHELFRGGVVYASKLFRGSEKSSLEGLWVSQRTEMSCTPSQK